jgi:hypothetical protein
MREAGSVQGKYEFLCHFTLTVSCNSNTDSHGFSLCLE